MKFQNGDLAKWKPEYAQNEEELNSVFVVLEPSDDGKCFIQPLDWDEKINGPIVPSFFTSMSFLMHA